MEDKILEVLIVGAGGIGSDYDSPDSIKCLTHAHAFKNHPAFKLVGFVDLDIERGNRAAAKWECEAFHDLDEAHKCIKRYDVITVAVPDSFHFDCLLEIAKFRPKFVLAEKPLCENLYQSKVIRDLFKDLGIPAIVNFRREFVPEFQKLREEIFLKNFGALLNVTAIYNRGFNHNGSHIISLLMFLVGLSKLDLVTVLSSQNDFSDRDKTYSGIFSIDNDNFLYLIGYNSNVFPCFELDLHFTEGRIRIVEGGDRIEFYKRAPYTIGGFEMVQKVMEIDTALDRSLFFMAEMIHLHLLDKASPHLTLDHSVQVMEFIECLKLS